MKTSTAPSKWNLTNLLPCGPDTEQFHNHVTSLKETLASLEGNEQSAPFNENELHTLAKLIQQVESAESFYYCLTTEKTDTALLASIHTNISALKSHIRLLVSKQQEKVSHMSDEQFEEWFSYTKEKRFLKDLKTDSKSSTEETVSNFAAETLTSLENIYAQARQNLTVQVELAGEKTELSFAESSHAALSHRDSSTRNHVFRELNRTLEKQAGLFASIYNAMVDLRLKEQQVRSTDDLEESLKVNGISKPVLDAMWTAVDRSLPGLTVYLNIKARESGKEKISWHDLMTSSQETSDEIPFPEAVSGISDALAPIDRNQSTFINETIQSGWVDADPRDTKPPGGFCAPFMPEDESRISLNYDNSIDSARRLAHELGHAWHFKQMKNAPTLTFSDDTFEMTTAETASIFFETAYIDHLIENTSDALVKKAILGAKIERSLNYLMAIRGAFLFENRFYEARKKGPKDAEQLEHLSLQSQKEAFGSSLSEYEPFIWIKYVQFYQANVPFYNYPYSLGFLLSIGLLDRAKKDPHFTRKYQGFLSETGLLPLEELVEKHFDINLAHTDFWEQAIHQITQDIEQYRQL
ncbi:peptidase M3 [Alteribacter lacisalsi]|uniref:Peptidase M3 n=1 Tax=Alteribacter lacisalsi TaxID=2045244 RepID=A0A2W0H6E5_9BACI|nr:peptidase M3 [Alteribacter lacisalsi]PYZ96687.1 peptidase M3 [Alteribacter lacisalsi]